MHGGGRWVRASAELIGVEGYVCYFGDQYWRVTFVWKSGRLSKRCKLKKGDVNE